MRAYARGRALRARLARGMRWEGVRILGYHRVADHRHDLAVPPAAFREQMERVLEAGLEPIRLDAALNLLREPVEGRYVCVTFDDGYLDNLEAAAPILRELGIPATVYVPTAVIDGEASYTWFADPPPAMTWDDVGRLIEGGLIDVQPHTRTHARLPRVDDEAAREEIVGAKRDLERHVPYEATSFCYPAGLYGEREVALVREAGYRAAVTTHPGVNRGGAPLEALNRTLVFGDDGPDLFAAKVAGHVDRPPLARRWLYRRLARA
jgi:peptidoglycan/xylan/chitin deacetylase (PgdA/CDA1 family)